VKAMVCESECNLGEFDVKAHQPRTRVFTLFSSFSLRGGDVKVMILGSVNIAPWIDKCAVRFLSVTIGKLHKGAEAPRQQRKQFVL
jgi:hypothetical protein